MAQYSSVLSQLLSHIPRSEFAGIVARHGGDKRVRRFRCWQQFVALFYGQLSGQQSLRDLETAVRVNRRKLQQVGLLNLSRSTLADANNRRSAAIFEELFHWLYGRCRRRAPGHRFRFHHRLYSVDASLIHLCWKVFKWARFMKRKGAAKLHVILDHEGLIPRVCVVTAAKTRELEVARRQRYEPDSILTFDRGYTDFCWFDQLHHQGVYFVTRQRKDAAYRVAKRRPVDSHTGLTSDQWIRPTHKCGRCYTGPLRRIGYRDRERGRFLVFLTNIEHLEAEEIVAIYKARWEIELFFKWVKQHLKIKTFLGTSPNAVMTQVWVALCVYLLVSYVKFLSRMGWRTYEVFKRIQVAVLEHRDLWELLIQPPASTRQSRHKPTQMNLYRRDVKPLFITI